MYPILQKQDVELLITLKCLSFDLMMTILLSAVQNLSGRFINTLHALANSSLNEMRWQIYCRLQIQKPLNPPIVRLLSQSCTILHNPKKTTFCTSHLRLCVTTKEKKNNLLTISNHSFVSSHTELSRFYTHKLVASVSFTNPDKSLMHSQNKMLKWATGFRVLPPIRSFQRLH